VLRVLLGLGVAAAIGAIALMTRSSQYAEISGHSLRYNRTGGVSGVLEALVLLAYVLPTIAPFFVSTVRLARTIGLLLVVSLIASVLVERNALTSVWCFFAAILSGVVWIAVARTERSTAGLQPLGENAAI
jgi:uncharacterized membrane protein